MNEFGERALASIKKNLPGWDQRYYARRTECGTTFCYAGQVMLEAGFSPMPDDEFLQEIRSWKAPDGRRTRSPYETARKLLGWSEDQADAVFYATEFNPSDMEEWDGDPVKMFEEFERWVREVDAW